MKPWTRGEYGELESLLSDGYPLTVIAKRLGRSKHSVVSICRKLGVQARRGPTIAFQNQIDEQAYSKLCEIAAERCCTPATMARIITELVIANEAFLEALLDDAELPSRSADGPLIYVDDDDSAGAPLRPAGAAVSPPMIVLHRIELCGTAAGPVLSGHIHP